MEDAIVTSLDNYLAIKAENERLKEENELLRKKLGEAKKRETYSPKIHVDGKDQIKGEGGKLLAHFAKEQTRTASRTRELEETLKKHIRSHYKLGDLFTTTQLKEFAGVESNKTTVFNNVIAKWKLKKVIEKEGWGVWRILSENFFNVQQ